MSFEFVNLSGPRIEKGTQRKVRSHVTSRNHAVNREVQRRFTRHATKLQPLRMRGESVEGGSMSLNLAAPVVNPQTFPTVASSLLPSPVTPLSASSPDPFDCFATAWTPIERYLIEHYVTYLLPRFNIFRSDEPSHSTFSHDMIHKWLPSALTDIGATNSVFLLAARSLAVLFQSTRFRQMALVYRLKCIQCVNGALSSEASKISDVTIISVLGLSSDEFHSGSIEASRNHTKAIRDMVRLRGGLKNLGLDGLLAHLVKWNLTTATTYTERHRSTALIWEEKCATLIESLAPGFWDQLSLFSEDTIEILNNVCSLCSIIRENSTGYSVSSFNASAAQYLTGRLILSMDPNQFSTSSSPVDECISLTLLIYLSCIFSQYSLNTGDQQLSSIIYRLRALLAEAMYVGFWRLPSERLRSITELQLWILFTVALAINYSETSLINITSSEYEISQFLWTGVAEDDKHWVTDTACILLNYVGIRSLEEMIMFMERYLWFPPPLEQCASQVWEAVVAERLRLTTKP
ncbi:hypothetical protein F5884DRAFT_898791 [Xylogone sp. PMI_703]|nr:hypothetical protein F5884DRAFT_898791 [Xylogone sp. PMI_703]